VAAGRLTEAQQEEILAELPGRIETQVDRTSAHAAYGGLPGDERPTAPDEPQPGTSTA
jgi:hypothetical protein